MTPEEQVRKERDRTRKAGGCDCPGCIAQILGVYPITGNDLNIYQEYSGGLPEDPAKYPLFNAILVVYGITDIPRIPLGVPDGKRLRYEVAVAAYCTLQ